MSAAPHGIRRRSAGVAVLAVVLCSAVFLAGAFSSSGSGDPTFFRGDGSHSFTCYLDKSSRHGNLKIEFLDNGRKAVVRLGGHEAVVTFESVGLGSDHYGGGSVKLHIDPEVYVSGLGPKSVDPCEQD